MATPDAERPADTPPAAGQAIRSQAWYSLGKRDDHGKLQYTQVRH